MMEAAVTKETGGGALGVPAAARVGAENGLGDFSRRKGVGSHVLCKSTRSII